MKWKWVLSLALILVPAVQAQQVNTTKVLWSIRTRDSVGIDEKVPMIGQFPPPQIYARWLVEIALCEGLPLPTEAQLRELTYWEVNAGDFQINADTTHAFIGMIDPDEKRMYLSIARVWDEETVKHEYLHMVLRWTFGEAYRGEHPMTYFGRCGMLDS